MSEERTQTERAAPQACPSLLAGRVLAAIAARAEVSAEVLFSRG